jgi:hypothetical protein
VVGRAGGRLSTSSTPCPRVNEIFPATVRQQRRFESRAAYVLDAVVLPLAPIEVPKKDPAPTRSQFGLPAAGTAQN